MATTYEVYRIPQDAQKTTTLDNTGYVVETYSVKYNLLIDQNDGDNEETVETGAQASGTPSRLPSEGDSHESKANATVDTVTTVQKSLLYFESTVTYKTPSYESGGGGETEDPTELPAKVRFSTSYEELEIDYDFDGDLIGNPETKEPYSLLTETADLVAVVTRALPSWNPLNTYLYPDTVNSDVFLGFPPGTAYLKTLDAETAKQGDTDYWSATAQVFFRKPGPGGILKDGTVIQDGDPAYAWYKRVIRKGFYAIFSDGKKHRIGLKPDGSYGIYDTDTSTAVPTRILLNEDDEILNDDEATGTNDPVFDLWKVKGSLPFNDLGFF